MNVKFTTDLIKASLIRALRTAIQVALAGFSIGMTITEVDWLTILSTSAVAGLYSFLTCVAAGIPEGSTDGVLQIDNSGEAKDIYRLDLGENLEKLATKKVVRFVVDPNAKIDK